MKRTFWIMQHLVRPLSGGLLFGAGLAGDSWLGVQLLQSAHAGWLPLVLHFPCVLIWAWGLFFITDAQTTKKLTWSTFMQNRWSITGLLIGLMPMPGLGTLSYSFALCGGLFLRRDKKGENERAEELDQELPQQNALPNLGIQPLIEHLNGDDLEMRRSAKFLQVSPLKPNILKAGPVQANVAQPTSCTISYDAKVLIIATDGNEADLPAIKQALDYVGTPYTVYIAAQTPGGLTPDKLSTGCHGNYQGVILTNGTLSYDNNGSWVSALSTQEWTTLWSYESTFGIREASWYTYPTADFGYQTPTNALDTTTAPIASQLTAQGKAAFTYLNPNTTIAIQDAYAYVAQPLTDGATQSLLNDANGDSLIAVRSYTDGRQVLSQTFDSNQYLTHDLVLSYGVLSWVTQGIFLGMHHSYMSAQVDDMFIDDTTWAPTTACGTNIDLTGTTYRINSSDLQATINWQNSVRSQQATAQTKLTLPFNGYGATNGVYNNDTLTPAVKQSSSNFNWVTHTYDHTELDTTTYAFSSWELTQNIKVANSIGLNNFDRNSMVTPSISGLTNINFLNAAYNNGIRYLVSDTSRGGNYTNPAPNVGTYNPLKPGILMIPRYPTNLFFNVSTPQEWVAEYNCMYASFWGHSLSYQQILDVESQTLLSYLLKGDMDPWMFHQPNLRAYDGTHSLLSDLLNLTFQKYQQYDNQPIVNQSMSTIGYTMAQFMNYKNANVVGTITPGVSISLTAQNSTLVAVTGEHLGISETYGGQNISYFSLAAGRSISLPIR